MPKIKVTCVNCGKAFEKYPSHITGKTFCSRDCFFEWWTANKTGWISTAGYRYVSDNGREIFEHRLVMEKHLGRELTINEHVHHINGDILDNRLENLEVIERGKHSTLHNTGREVSEQTRKKIGLANSGKGRPHTEEAKRKISLANKGRTISEETRRKQCLAQKERWRRYREQAG